MCPVLSEYAHYGEYRYTRWWVDMHYARVLCTGYYVIGAYVFCDWCTCTMSWVHVYLLLSSLRALASSCMDFLMSGRDALSDCDGWNDDNETMRPDETERGEVSYQTRFAFPLTFKLNIVPMVTQTHVYIHSLHLCLWHNLHNVWWHLLTEKRKTRWPISIDLNWV